MAPGASWRVFFSEGGLIHTASGIEGGLGSVNEALGMATKGLDQNLASVIEKTWRVTEVDDRWSHQETEGPDWSASYSRALRACEENR
ncbi:MAG TPA: hypothetical protein VGC53_09595 [Vicinamibacteria bacterium]